MKQVSKNFTPIIFGPAFSGPPFSAHAQKARCTKYLLKVESLVAYYAIFFKSL